MQKDNQTSVIIFSYNRAAQLHSCLASFYENFDAGNKDPKVAILWKASSKDFQKGYENIKQSFSHKKNLIWVEESNFHRQLNEIVRAIDTKLMMFLVDDDVFVDKVSISDTQFNLLKSPAMLAISLRLHSGVTHCFPINRDTVVPKFTKKMVWTWKNQQGDWGYPMSVDGNIYKTDIIKEIVSKISFSNPNTFEATLDAVSKQHNFPQYMCCYPEGPRLFNIPANLVQTQYENRIFGGMSAEELNTKYLDGQIIDYNRYVGMKPNTVHVPVELFLVPKENK